MSESAQEIKDLQNHKVLLTWIENHISDSSFKGTEAANAAAALSFVRYMRTAATDRIDELRKSVTKSTEAVSEVS
jgi:hypothetical protein